MTFFSYDLIISYDKISVKNYSVYVYNHKLFFDII